MSLRIRSENRYTCKQKNNRYDIVTNKKHFFNIMGKNTPQTSKKYSIRHVSIKKGTQQSKKEFTCRRKDCTFKTLIYNKLCDHIENNHLCRRCNCACKNIITHKCRKEADNTEIPDVAIDDTTFTIKQKSNKGAVVTLFHKYTMKLILLEEAIQLVHTDLAKLLNKYIKKHNGIRAMISVQAMCTELKTGDQKIKTFHSPFSRLTHSAFTDEVIIFSRDYIENVIRLLTETGSGIRIEEFIGMDVNIGIYRPIRPRGFIKLPKKLRGRHGLLNIKTKNQCFKLCIVAALFPEKIKFKKYSDVSEVDRTYYHKKYFTRMMQSETTYISAITEIENKKLLDFSGFENNFDINDLHLFEERNKLTINIYEWNDQDELVTPFRITKLNFGPKKHINLLLLSNDKGDHVVLIQDSSRFFGKSGFRKKQVCPWCLQGYVNPDHERRCKAQHDIGLILPSIEGNKIKFKDFHKCLPPVYRMYSDLLYINSKDGITVGGYGFVAIGPEGEIVDKEFYIGEKSMEMYLTRVLDLAKEMKTQIECTNLPLPEMSNEEQAEFDMATTCTVCGCDFSLHNPKVRHHSHHISGYKISPVCQRDNLQIKAKTQIPLFSPTQTKLGSHLILQNLKSTQQVSINIIPKSNENFISVILGNKLKLVDTRKFLDFSLQDLIKIYVSSGNIEKLAVFQDDLELEILKEEFYFPHTWFTSMTQLREKTFPPPENFVDILADKDINANDYCKAESLYKKLQCDTFEDYCMAYLKGRVYQTAAIMEEFGDWCFQNYNLSPLHDLSLASYAYSLALFNAKTEIEIPTDEVIVKLIVDNIRGGVSHLSKRVVTSKSERLGHSDVKDEDRIEILIADLNSLYQSCLSQPMPLSSYRVLSDDEMKKINIQDLNERDGKGWIISATLDYPDSIKEGSKDYPFCPTNQKMKLGYVKGDSQEMRDSCVMSQQHHFGVNVLTLTQLQKENVAIYYKLLQFYLKHGLVINKVHHIIEFNESDYLKPFIDKNIGIRKSVPDKFHEGISKLIGNMVFGKFLAIHNNLNVKCVNTKSRALTLLAKHDFANFKIVSSDVSLFYGKKNAEKLDKNILVSFVVLDLAKLKLYELIYDVLKPKFGSRITIVASETDNLVAEIRDYNKSFIQDLKDIQHAFDFSTLPLDHPLYDNSRAKEPGLLKIEYPYPLQFVGIRAKLYSILNQCQSCRRTLTDDGSIVCNTCQDPSNSKPQNVPKGGPRRRHTPHEVYLKTALGQNNTPLVDFLSLRCENQNVKLNEMKKTVFRTTDNHRIWLNYNESVPFGYATT